MTTQLKGYEENYSITPEGVVTNIKTNRVKTATVYSNGYPVVDLYKDNKSSKQLLHRLLAIHFIPNPENKPHINHIDGNKLNHSLDNLEWCTHKENVIHAYRTGLNPGSSKVTEQHLKEIYTRFFNGENLTQISKDLPFNNVTVSNHFTKMIKALGEEEKRAKQEALNIKLRMVKSGKNKRIKMILNMLDKTTGKVIQTFNCMKEAQDFLQVKGSGPIHNVISGRQKTAYGYKWSKF